MGDMFIGVHPGQFHGGGGAGWEGDHSLKDALLFQMGHDLPEARGVLYVSPGIVV
jgi:hypothetical protein